jgi:hypothetical protein
MFDLYKSVTPKKYSCLPRYTHLKCSRPQPESHLFPDGQTKRMRARGRVGLPEGASE